MIAQCQLPELAEPYASAAREAVAYIIERWQPIAIILAGSVLRGEGDASSDMDTFVIFEGSYRQRVQKRFNGVPFEIFANPPRRARRYLEEEQLDGGGSTIHMLATGFVVLNRDAVITDLIQRSQYILTQTPLPLDSHLIYQRYMAADKFENALDLRQREPALGLLLASSAMLDMLNYYFISQSKWIPRHKDLLKTLRSENPELARLVEQFFQATGDIRFDLAAQIADRTIGTRGFFEWESEQDKVK